MILRQLYSIINPSQQLVLLIRVYSYLYTMKITRPFSYFLYYIVRIIFSSDIHPNAKIGKNFSIRHHFGIVIGKNAIIGDDVIIYNDVSIGQKNISDSTMPIIGNCCIIYKGAVIVGGVTLKEGSIVSANKLIKE